MFNIRPYTTNDYAMVCSWWTAADEIPPTQGMLPTDTTFVLEIENTPALCVAVYFTNTSEICYMSSFAGNPELKGEKRREGAKVLVDTVAAFAKACGYKHMLCFAYKDKLKKRYEELGFSPTLSNMTGFVRKVQ